MRPLLHRRAECPHATLQLDVNRFVSTLYACCPLDELPAAAVWLPWRVMPADFNTRMFRSDNPPDLLKFIKTTTRPELVGDRNLAKARTRVYSVLATYIQAAALYMTEYGPDVRTVCVEAMQRESDAKASAGVLAPLSQLVLSGVFNSVTLAADGLFDVAMKLVRVGKVMPTVKGGLRLAGGGVVVAWWCLRGGVCVVVW